MAEFRKGDIVAVMINVKDPYGRMNTDWKAAVYRNPDKNGGHWVIELPISQYDDHKCHSFYYGPDEVRPAFDIWPWLNGCTADLHDCYAEECQP